MTEKSDELKELEAAAQQSTREIVESENELRSNSLPIPSQSIDAVIGASITNYKEFQEAELVELAAMTPRQIQDRIRQYSFQIWQTTTKRAAAHGYLNQLAAKLSKEEKAALKLTDVSFNPKELVTPQKLHGKGKDAGLSNEEKQAKDMQKVLPHMSIPEILEMIRKGRGAAFHRGLASGSGVPQSIDTCDKCKTDYPTGEKHECGDTSAVTAPIESLPESQVNPQPITSESLMDRLARLRREGNK